MANSHWFQPMPLRWEKLLFYAPDADMFPANEGEWDSESRYQFLVHSDTVAVRPFFAAYHVEVIYVGGLGVGGW
jgi:hypothetical protein